MGWRNVCVGKEKCSNSTFKQYRFSAQLMEPLKSYYLFKRRKFQNFWLFSRIQNFSKMRYSTYNRISKYFQSPLLSFGSALDSFQNPNRSETGPNRSEQVLGTMNSTLKGFFNKKNIHTLMKLELCFYGFLRAFSI